jgi:RNA ligase
MKFTDYIGIDMAEFQTKYIDTGLVTASYHDEFPLAIYSYGRRTILWDNVTTKCRGVIVDNETGDVIARPFEKFHNYGSTMNVGCSTSCLGLGEPVIWEKMDGFMATMYTWKGIDYIASKGSFHSIHAKWATAWLRKKWGNSVPFHQPGTTLVFEGLHRDLRIVVDYGLRQVLVLLAVIDNETGWEYEPRELEAFAKAAHFSIPQRATMMTVHDAVEITREGPPKDCDEGLDEGYVLAWYRQGTTPFRLKLKFIEYLRLHRLVTGVTPKRIWECLSTSQTTELNEFLNDSTPWFAKFVQKWVSALTGEFEGLRLAANARYAVCKETVRVKVGQRPYVYPAEERKAWALEFQRPENEGFRGILFSMLDNKAVDKVIWKQVKQMTKGSNPMVDAHA